MVRHSLLALALAVGTAASVSAQYEIVSNVAGTWMDISATGTPLILGDDQSVQIFNSVSNPFLPANAWVNSNGTIGAGLFTSYTNTVLPNATFHGGRGLAMLWDDLNPATGGTIHWQQIGTTLVVQFTNVPFFGSAGETNTFQVQVFGAGTSYAQFLYQGPMTTARQRGNSATIGAQLDPSSAIMYSFDQDILTPGTVLTLRDQNPNAQGACCFNTGACDFITRAACMAAGGTFAGDNVTCAAANCPQPGACCVGGNCTILLPSACASQFGVWQNTATCSGINCPPSWQVMQPAPEARSRAAGAMVGDFFYFMGGEAATGWGTTAWKLDLGANTWSPIASLPPVPAGLGGLSNIAAASLGTDVYIVGGWDGALAYNRVIRYDTTTDTWAEVTTDPLPTPIFANGLVGHNNRLYVVGGAVALGILSTVTYVYDPAAPAGTRWTTAPGPNISRQFPGAVGIGNSIYLTGGISSTVTPEYNSAERFDLTTNTWTPLPDMAAIRGGGAAYNANGQLVVASGGWSTYRTSTEQFDGAAWAGYVPVNFGARTIAYASNGNRLVKAAGWNGAYIANTEMLVLGGTACYPNCDESTVAPILNVDDFTCFINSYASAQGLPPAQQLTHYANCDGSTVHPVLNVDDFTCFINQYAQGCP
jgi:hypothetical protein